MNNAWEVGSALKILLGRLELGDKNSAWDSVEGVPSLLEYRFLMEAAQAYSDDILIGPPPAVYPGRVKVVRLHHEQVAECLCNQRHIDARRGSLVLGASADIDFFARLAKSVIVARTEGTNAVISNFVVATLPEYLNTCARLVSFYGDDIFFAREPRLLPNIFVTVWVNRDNVTWTKEQVPDAAPAVAPLRRCLPLRRRKNEASKSCTTCTCTMDAKLKRRITIVLGVLGAVNVAALVLNAIVAFAFDNVDAGDGSLFSYGIIAWLLGLRHACDADHIAAIDNTTRRLALLGRESVFIGGYFALGHSTIVAVMCIIVAISSSAASTALKRPATSRASLARASRSPFSRSSGSPTCGCSWR